MQTRSEHRVLNHRRVAMTLVEVLTVTAIIAIVSAIAWAAIGGRVKAAGKRAVLKSDLRQIVVALNLYRADYYDEFPSNWKSIGYYGVNRKDKFGPGFPPTDRFYDKPPSYDVSYHTPECAAPPSKSPTIFVFRQFIQQYNSRPRLNPLDLESTPAVYFRPACIPNSFGKHSFSFISNGVTHTVEINHQQSLGINLSGSLTYQ